LRWPSPQDYREAIQTLATSVSDEELRAGEIAVDPLQLPVVNSGQYAAVFKITNSRHKAWAVRCFLHNFPDRQERYKKISQFILNDNLEYTVDFELIDKGIRVGNDWFPLLKMEYVDGKSLGRYVRENINDVTKLKGLIHQFEEMMGTLKENGIAHGDLQHDNIVVNEAGRLRLIDYDGMFVPDLKGWHSNELGHRNYQHPQRTELDFGPELDNFSAWLIRGALECLQTEPKTHNMFLANEEGFLLAREDFISCDSSRKLHDLESMGGRCREYSRQIRTLLRQHCSGLPYLDEKLALDKSLRPIAVLELPKVIAKPTELKQLLSEPGSALSKSSANSIQVFSPDLLTDWNNSLNCFPRELIGTLNVPKRSKIPKQEIVRLMSEGLAPGETIVWSGGLSPMKDAQTTLPRSLVFILRYFIVLAVFAAIIFITSLPLSQIIVAETIGSVVLMFGVIPLVLILDRLGGPGTAQAHQIYALTEKNLKIVVNSKYRRGITDVNKMDVDLFSFNVPLKQIVIVDFPAVDESSVKIKVEVSSKVPSRKKFRTFFLLGFTAKDRLALLTRLRSLGVQCSMPKV